MQRVILGICFAFCISSVFADSINSNCTHESGTTKCKFTESNQDLMDLSCKNESGKSSCHGKFFDNQAQNVDMSCTSDREAFSFKCTGGAGRDKFSLYCGPAELEFGKFGCSITDGSGQSVKLICDMMNGTGMPNCSGIDSDGVKHTINCTNDATGKSVCSIK